MRTKRCIGTVASVGAVISHQSLSHDVTTVHVSAEAKRVLRHGIIRPRSSSFRATPMMPFAFSSIATTEEEAGTRRPKFVISGATRLSDYSDVGSLLVDTFDVTSSAQSAALGLDNLLWKMGVARALVARRYTNRYISTVRKMRGKKYALLLAKSSDDESNSRNGGGTVRAKRGEQGTVVGVTELGLSRYPLAIDACTESNDSTIHKTEVLASVGVLAVNPSQRRRGVGSALLSAAESVVRLWNETYIYAAVEPSNEAALGFFARQGYEPVKSYTSAGGNAVVRVYVDVAERLRRERRPHILLRKEIVNNNSSSVSEGGVSSVTITK
mmetsp:Transcript_1910/g.4440  ORF Transcript_1910/g.4440 Transcript_1910/m.4440 type:complete len:327 (+) Transcript_1910:45-1025(+)